MMWQKCYADKEYGVQEGLKWLKLKRHFISNRWFFSSPSKLKPRSLFFTTTEYQNIHHRPSLCRCCTAVNSRCSVVNRILSSFFGLNRILSIHKPVIKKTIFIVVLIMQNHKHNSGAIFFFNILLNHCVMTYWIIYPNLVQSFDYFMVDLM